MGVRLKTKYSTSCSTEKEQRIFTPYVPDGEIRLFILSDVKGSNRNKQPASLQ
jgi:hypothetical protein